MIEKSNFFNEEQKAFKGQLMDLLMDTMRTATVEFNEKFRDGQLLSDLCISVVAMFAREVFLVGADLGGHMVSGQTTLSEVAHMWDCLSGEIKKDIVEKLRSFSACGKTIN